MHTNEHNCVWLLIALTPKTCTWAAVSHYTLDMSCVSRPNRHMPNEASDRPLGGSVTIMQSSSTGACDVMPWPSRRCRPIRTKSRQNESRFRSNGTHAKWSDL